METLRVPSVKWALYYLIVGLKRHFKLSFNCLSLDLMNDLNLNEEM